MVSVRGVVTNIAIPPGGGMVVLFLYGGECVNLAVRHVDFAATWDGRDVTAPELMARLWGRDGSEVTVEAVRTDDRLQTTIEATFTTSKGSDA